MRTTGQMRDAANTFSVLGRLRAFWLVAIVMAVCVGLMPQAWAQAPTPTVTGFVGSTNVPQTNSTTNVQAPPSSIIVQGSGFQAGVTTAVFGSFFDIIPQVISSTVIAVPVPPGFASSNVGSTATLAICNNQNCATGGPTITLTVIAPVPSAGTATATPTPTTTVGTTTISAQFKRSTTAGTTLPEPGAPSGTVSFTAAGGAQGSAALVLDTTATFVPTATVTAIPTTATPAIAPPTGTYAGSQSVNITDSNPNAVIYFTNDGTVPTASSTRYSNPLTVTQTTTIKAIAIAAGSFNSAVATATLTIFVPISTSLAFVQQPTTTVTGQVITPAVTVAVLDQNGNQITTANTPVSIALAANPSYGTLRGTMTVNAVNGLATFPDLSIVQIATGDTFLAYSSGLVSTNSTAFNITPPPITVTPFAPLIGVSTTLSGSFTLGVPAPAGAVTTVNLASSVPANVTISPASVTVAAGQSTGSFTYTGVGPGASNLTATATNYQVGTATVTATYSLVSLGTIPSVAPGQSVSIALSIAVAAPAGGLTVSFTSSNPSVATVTSSVFIPAGQRTAAVNPQIVGVVIGSTVITASAPGYAPDTRTVPVTVVASFTPGNITIAHQTYSTVTLNISAPATTGGLTFTTTSDNTRFATVPASVTIPAGQTSVVVPLTGVADGSTTIRADSAGVAEATLGVTVSTVLSLYYGNTTTGVYIQGSNYFYVPSTPASPSTFTVTSSNPAVATISKSTAAVGTASVTFDNITSSTLNTIYFQGQSTGTTTITMSGPGYTTGTNTVTVYPSGIVVQQGNFSTTTFSAASQITVVPAILNPGSLTIYNYNSTLNPGLGAISVPVTSSNTSVGTITTSPAVIAAGQSSGTTNFQPTGPGTSTVAIGTPTGLSGFSTPASNTSITATVTAPQLQFYYGNSTTGVNMIVQNLVYITTAPPSATTFTVTSSNPAVATVSTSTTTVGTASVTYPGITNAGTYPVYFQGLSTGTTTITLSGAGYTSGTITVTVDPSGFTFAGNNGFSTTSFSGPTTVYVYPTILNPQTLTEYGLGTLSPGVGTISVPVTSATPSVGTITSSPITFTGGSGYMTTTFQPSSAGTSVISIGTPTGAAGFSTPATSLTQYTATVTAPQLSIYYGSPITGVNIMNTNYASIPVAPPSPVTVTVTSSNPAVATISTSSTTVGTASVSFTGVSTATNLPIYLQGQTVGTTTLTISAPGYTTGTTTLTVYPSGFTFAYGSGFTTTTFSSPTSISVYPSILSPQSLNYYTSGNLNPGLPTISVPVTSSNTTVGSITASPVMFPATSNAQATTFQPTSAGTSTLALGTPTGVAGFSTPSNYTSLTATVTAPQLSFYYTSETTGVNIEVTNFGYLPATPPNPVTVTVVSNGPAIALLSNSATTAGTSSLTFTNVTSSGYLPTFFIQGQAVGTTTLTISAPGYSNGIANVAVNPSGFTFASSYNGGLSTTASSSATTLYVYPSILNNGTYTYYSSSQFSPVSGGVSVPVTSSNTAVGRISTSPLVFSGGESYLTTNFIPVATGTTNITITQPSGFSLPSQYIVINATVQ